MKAIETFYAENASMQENAAPPRAPRMNLIAHEAAVLARVTHVDSKAIVSIVESDRAAIH